MSQNAITIKVLKIAILTAIAPLSSLLGHAVLTASGKEEGAGTTRLDLALSSWVGTAIICLSLGSCFIIASESKQYSAKSSTHAPEPFGEVSPSPPSPMVAVILLYLLASLALSAPSASLGAVILGSDIRYTAKSTATGVGIGMGAELFLCFLYGLWQIYQNGSLKTLLRLSSSDDPERLPIRPEQLPDYGAINNPQ